MFSSNSLNPQGVFEDYKTSLLMNNPQGVFEDYKTSLLMNNRGKQMRQLLEDSNICPISMRLKM